MKAIFYHLAATDPLDPGVVIESREPVFEPWMISGIEQLHRPYRGLLRMSLRVDAVKHADDHHRAGGWQQVELDQYTDEQLGQLIRLHLINLDAAGAHRATVILSLNPDTP